MPERDYRAKRDFNATPEPKAKFEGNVDVAEAVPGGRFMIHQHHATRLHYDLRLEFYNGDLPVLASWAVPRNLPREKGEARLAIHVEDHPIEYGEFSGTIPAGNYGAGEVRIFDSGTYEVLEQGPGKLTLRLDGGRLKGEWHLNRTDVKDGKEQWLAILSRWDGPLPESPPAPEPMLASPARNAFDDDGWIFEFKWDGVRALGVCTAETMLISRRRRDITATYPELGGLHDRLVALDAVVDGEIVALSDGRPSFERLQSRMNLQNPRDIEREAARTPVTYVVFDLLYLDGHDLSSEPIEVRKQMLEDVVVPSDKVVVSTWIRGEGSAVNEAAEARRLEGIVAKKLGSIYKPGRRTKEWLKIKSVHEADLVIGGWQPGEGRRSGVFGSLLMGAYDDEGLHFVGSVGTGFDDKTLTRMTDALAEIAQDECPFSTDPRTAGGGSAFGKPIRHPHWVDPCLVAKIEFRELTSGSRLRAPSFKGLRFDKEPEDCTFADLEAAAS